MNTLRATHTHHHHHHHLTRTIITPTMPDYHCCHNPRDYVHAGRVSGGRYVFHHHTQAPGDIVSLDAHTAHELARYLLADVGDVANVGPKPPTTPTLATAPPAAAAAAAVAVEGKPTTAPAPTVPLGEPEYHYLLQGQLRVAKVHRRATEAAAERRVAARHESDGGTDGGTDDDA